MPVLVDIGLLILCVCAGAALVVFAHGDLLRVAQRRREFVEFAERQMRLKELEVRLKELEAGNREQELRNQRRSLDLRERELVLDEQEAAEDRDEDEF